MSKSASILVGSQQRRCPLLCCGAGDWQLSISAARAPAAACRCCSLAIARRDRQTDRRTDGHRTITSSTLTAVGRFQLLARWPGTNFLILSGIQRAAQTVLGVYLERTCSRDASASSALGVLNDYALYKSTHALTHVDALVATSDENVEKHSTFDCSRGVDPMCFSGSGPTHFLGAGSG